MPLAAWHLMKVADDRNVITWADHVLVWPEGFSQLYVLPGVQHCNEGGPGAGTFDKMAAISDWVEKGVPPQVLQASHLNGTGTATFTRPMCPFPQYPRYLGSGDPNRAKSFICSVN
jgi:tannase/feruloyl esterase